MGRTLLWTVWALPLAILFAGFAAVVVSPDLGAALIALGGLLQVLKPAVFLFDVVRRGDLSGVAKLGWSLGILFFWDPAILVYLIQRLGTEREPAASGPEIPGAWPDAAGSTTPLGWSGRAPEASPVTTDGLRELARAVRPASGRLVAARQARDAVEAARQATEDQVDMLQRLVGDADFAEEGASALADARARHTRLVALEEALAEGVARLTAARDRADRVVDDGHATEAQVALQDLEAALARLEDPMAEEARRSAAEGRPSVG